MLALALASLTAITALSVYAIVATRKAGRVEVLEERLIVAQENLVHATNEATAQRKRADGLDALLAEAIATRPVAGAWGVLQAKWAVARVADGNAASVSDGGTAGGSAGAAAKGHVGDRLIDPWADDA